MADSKKYTYQAKDGIDRIVPGVGRSVNGVLQSDVKIENPNFSLVSDNSQPAQATASATPVKPAPVNVTTPASVQPPAPAAPAPTQDNKNEKE